MNGFLVGGTASGVGKTTVTLALIASLRRRGLAVQPFKGGPDFLDTTHHSRIAGRAARNLDTWMLGREANREVLRAASADADAVVVEGMMGLFDGKDALSETGSSAEIAKLLKLPVLLVVDAAKSARSVAAIVLGFELFDPELPLAGVILNRVASERHFQLLASAIAATCKTPVIGSLPREPAIAIPERHLGLHPAVSDDSSPATLDREIDTLAALAEKHFDIEAILQFSLADIANGQKNPPLLPFSDKNPPKNSDSVSTGICTGGSIENEAPVRIGVPRDSAFLFYYEDNLDLLRQAGAEIVPFSPIDGCSLPPDLDALYLGGGYPEIHAEQLSANSSMREQVRQFAASGRPVYAECGSLLYLALDLKTASLATSDGTTWPMAGALPLHMEMTPRLVDFGYVTVTFTGDCVLGSTGTVVRGHSFHYSRIAPGRSPSAQEEIPTAYSVHYSLSGKTQQEGYGGGNLLGSYVHLHFRANPHVAANFVAAARRFKATRQVTA